MFRTHVMTAVAVSTGMVAIGLLTDPNFGYPPIINYLIFLSIIVFGSLLPDIDHANSYISRKLNFSLPFKHRGFTHTIYPWVIMMFYGIWFDSFITEVIFYLGFGALLHMLGDCHTYGGVRLLGYGKANYILPKFMRWKTGSSVENIWFFGYFIIFLTSIFTIAY